MHHNPRNIEGDEEVSSRRAELRLLELELRLVQLESRRVCGGSPGTPTPGSEQPPGALTEAEQQRRSSLQAPSPVGSLLAQEQLEVASAAGTPVGTPPPPEPLQLSRRPSCALSPSSADPRGSRTPRKSSSSPRGDKHNGRLPRSVVRDLAEAAAQEAHRQLEALRLRGAARQRELAMHTRALQTQTEAVRAAAEELRKLEARTRQHPGSVTIDTLGRWERDRWLAGTEREARRLRLQLGSLRMRERRAEHEPSAADVQLLRVQAERQQEQLAELGQACQLAYQQRTGPLGCRHAAALSAGAAGREAEAAGLVREVAARRTRTDERRGVLLAMEIRNQQLARRALALESALVPSGQHARDLQLVSCVASLHARELALEREVRSLERRRGLLRVQTSRLARSAAVRTARQPHEEAVPRCSPASSPRSHLSHETLQLRAMHELTSTDSNATSSSSGEETNNFLLPPENPRNCLL